MMLDLAHLAEQLVDGSENPTRRFPSSGRVIAPPDHDVADALAELAEVAWPGIVAAELAIDPGDDLLRQPLDFLVDPSSVFGARAGIRPPSSSVLEREHLPR